MGTANEARGEVASFLGLLAKAEIAVLCNHVSVRRVRRFERISWEGARDVGELLRTDPVTVRQYIATIEQGAFSALLFDGALIQISFDIQHKRIVGHRLAYFPCPFDLDQELLILEPILDVLDAYREDREALRLRAPIRFDYDASRQRLGHPASHLTILWPHCRWAVSRPLSLGHFVRFVFRHFYPDLWRAHQFLRDWPQRFDDRTILPEEERALFVECRDG